MKTLYRALSKPPIRVSLGGVDPEYDSHTWSLCNAAKLLGCGVFPACEPFHWIVLL